MARKSPYPGVYPTGPRTWCYRLRLPRDPETGQRPIEARGGFATARAAHDARVRRQAQLLDGVATRAAPGTLGAYLRGWLAERRDIRASSRTRYAAAIERHIAPDLGDVPLAALAPAQIRRWQNALSDRLAPATVAFARGVLVAALRQAVADQLIAWNPAASVAPPPASRARPVVWDADQLQRFLAVADADADAALWRLAVYAQLRPGEILALGWDQVDLDAGTVAVVTTRTLDARGRAVRGTAPKTRDGERTIAIPPSCVAALRRHRAAQLERRLAWSLGEAWNLAGLVFPSVRGTLRAHSTLVGQLERLAERAGLPRITPHGLRHAGATWLAELGESPATISRRLGHTSVAFTLDNYVHPGDASQRAAAERLERDGERRRTS